MDGSHRTRVEAMLSDAAAEHARLVALVTPELRESLPVDAQGVTQAIDHLARTAGLSESERRALIRPHAVNPAVLHARVFGGAPLARETVIGSFVEGARVRADALTAVADAVGGEDLVGAVRAVLIEHPPPLEAGDERAVAELQATYAAHEEAAILIASSLDDDGA